MKLGDTDLLKMFGIHIPSWVIYLFVVGLIVFLGLVYGFFNTPAKQTKHKKRRSRGNYDEYMDAKREHEWLERQRKRQNTSARKHVNNTVRTNPEQFNKTNSAKFTQQGKRRFK